MAVWLAWAIVSLRRAAWAPVLVFAIHIVAILGFDIYRQFPEFDIPMHFVGGVAIAYFFGRSYRTAAERNLLGQPANVVFAPMILGLTCLSAVIWEFAEFVVEQRFGIQTQPSLADTMLDLLLGLLGGAIWIAWNREPSR